MDSTWFAANIGRSRLIAVVRSEILPISEDLRGLLDSLGEGLVPLAEGVRGSGASPASALPRLSDVARGSGRPWRGVPPGQGG